MEKNNKIRKYIKGYLFILPNFIGFFVFMALPIIMGLVISFTDYNGFSQFNFVGLKNYIDMFHDEYFTVSLKNNLVYTLVTVPQLELIYRYCHVHDGNHRVRAAFGRGSQ